MTGRWGKSSRLVWRAYRNRSDLVFYALIRLTSRETLSISLPLYHHNQLSYYGIKMCIFMDPLIFHVELALDPMPCLGCSVLDWGEHYHSRSLFSIFVFFIFIAIQLHQTWNVRKISLFIDTLKSLISPPYAQKWPTRIKEAGRASSKISVTSKMQKLGTMSICSPLKNKKGMEIFKHRKLYVCIRGRGLTPSIYGF